MSDEREQGTLPDKDTPPWLQAVPEEEEPEGFFTGRRKLVFSAVFAVAAVALFGAVLWTLYRNTDTGPARHVSAPQVAYKEKPADPGGMDVPYQDKKVFEEADGAKVHESVNLGAQPEQPLTELPAESTAPESEQQAVETEPAASLPTPQPAPRKAEVTPEPTPKAEASAPKTQSTPAEKNVAATKAYRVQLGAYGSEKGAEKAWRVIKGKYRDLLPGDLEPSYEPVQSGDRTLYRLRVGPMENRAQADAVCLGLRARQQACIVVNP